MDLNDKTLVDWFKTRKPKHFGVLKTNYITRYNELEDFLNSEVHPLVAIGAALKDGIFLNEHGVYHIATVVNKASELLASRDASLSAYETYLFLAALQVHDIGNILGRSQHEAKIKELAGRLDSILGQDSVEKRLIYSIAEAHGGTKNGDKDTIRRISEYPSHSHKIRARSLAALLRFSDELADDSQRISHFAIDQNVIPDKSLLHHKYSASLDSVIVDIKAQAIELHYAVNEHDAKQKFPPNKSGAYLLDEIFHRTLKMHRERIYCMPFLRQLGILTEFIQVKINVYRVGEADNIAIGYRLEEHGYPAGYTEQIYDMCPDLKRWWKGKRLNGETLKALLSGGHKK